MRALKPCSWPLRVNKLEMGKKVNWGGGGVVVSDPKDEVLHSIPKCHPSIVNNIHPREPIGQPKMKV